MARIKIAGKTFFEGSDEQVNAFQQVIDKTMRTGGAWLTQNAAGLTGGCTVAWVGQGIPVLIHYDTQRPGAELVI